jgi:hypothetical protein
MDDLPGATALGSVIFIPISSFCLPSSSQPALA